MGNVDPCLITAIRVIIHNASLDKALHRAVIPLRPIAAG
jgi:hypothetical protein